MHASELHGAAAGKRGASCLPESDMPASNMLLLLAKVELQCFHLQAITELAARLEGLELA